MKRAKVTFEVEVELLIEDDAIDRCIENHDDNGVPQPDVTGGDGWRNRYYDLSTPAMVAEHLAYNALHHRSIASLDGWADLPDSAMKVIVAEWEPMGTVIGEDV